MRGLQALRNHHHTIVTHWAYQLDLVALILTAMGFMTKKIYALKFLG
jgi:hypothetical protein